MGSIVLTPTTDQTLQIVPVSLADALAVAQNAVTMATQAQNVAVVNATATHADRVLADTDAATATSAAATATSAAALAQKWATQALTEVAPGQGYGAAKYAADAARNASLAAEAENTASSKADQALAASAAIAAAVAAVTAAEPAAAAAVAAAGTATFEANAAAASALTASNAVTTVTGMGRILVTDVLTVATLNVIPALSYSPIQLSMVFLNGRLIPPSEYTLVANVITWTSTLFTAAIGDSVMVVYTTSSQRIQTDIPNIIVTNTIPSLTHTPLNAIFLFFLNGALIPPSYYTVSGTEITWTSTTTTVSVGSTVVVVYNY